MHYTTLNKIRHHSPCTEGWIKLLKHLGKTTADDEPVSFETILESNGLGDAAWCLQTTDNSHREARLFAVFCDRQMHSLIVDDLLTYAIDVAEQYANEKAPEAQLAALERRIFSLLDTGHYKTSYVVADSVWMTTCPNINFYAPCISVTALRIAKIISNESAYAEQLEKFRELLCQPDIQYTP